MATIPVFNPTVPFLGEIPGGLFVGKKLHIHGRVLPNGENGFFNINLQSGAAVNPRDDAPLHVSIRVATGKVILNSFQAGAWQQEERGSRCPIDWNEPFQMVIKVKEEHYKISLNGKDCGKPLESVRFIHIGDSGMIESITESC